MSNSAQDPHEQTPISLARQELERVTAEIAVRRKEAALEILRLMEEHKLLPGDISVSPAEAQARDWSLDERRLPDSALQELRRSLDRTVDLTGLHGQQVFSLLEEVARTVGARLGRTIARSAAGRWEDRRAELTAAFTGAITSSCKEYDAEVARLARPPTSRPPSGHW